MSVWTAILQRWLGRYGRVYYLLVAFLFLGGREIYYLRYSQRPWGLRLFFFSFTLALVSWWHMDLSDLRHLSEQESAVEENPKHLFNNDVGLRNNSRHRNVIAYCLIAMGVGLFFVGFQVLIWGFLFWGAFLGMAGCILLTLF